MDDKVILLWSVIASASHHQCLTLLWPWSSVSSHTLNAGCLVPIGGFQLLLACFACLVRWCPPGSYVCVVVVMVDFISGGSHIYVNVRLPSRSRGSSTLWSICDTVVIIVFVQTCHNTYCEVLFSSSLLVAQTLKYSAHRFKLIQKERIQNRESALFIVLRLFSSNFVRQPASATICCLLFLTLFLFPISPPPVSVILFSGADSEESAVEQDVRGEKKPLCSNICLSLR